MAARAAACAFAIPGDLGLPTGGYAYDRHVLARLAGHGVEVRHVPLPGSYPSPTADDLAATEATLAALPAATLLLIDGLAFGAMPRRLVARIRQPIVALCHHPLALEAGLAPARAAELHASEAAALALARHVIVTSRTTARTLAADFAVPAERITVAEPGTERAARAAGSRVEVPGAAASGAGTPLALLAVGSVVPRKGYDVLVAALAGLAEATTVAWHLDIAGADDRSPATTQALAEQIAAAGLGSRIRLLGAQSDAELARLYAEADLFLMPSLFEGYGMVLAEAMARGLPIVCTTGGAAAETVPPGAAIKVPPGDATALRQGVLQMLADPDLRQNVAAASWAAGQQLPTWDDTARTIAGVLRAVAATGVAPPDRERHPS